MHWLYFNEELTEMVFKFSLYIWLELGLKSWGSVSCIAGDRVYNIRAQLACMHVLVLTKFTR